MKTLVPMILIGLIALAVCWRYSLPTRAPAAVPLAVLAEKALAWAGGMVLSTVAAKIGDSAVNYLSCSGHRETLKDAQRTLEKTNYAKACRDAGGTLADGATGAIARTASDIGALSEQFRAHGMASHLCDAATWAITLDSMAPQDLATAALPSGTTRRDRTWYGAAKLLMGVIAHDLRTLATTACTPPPPPEDRFCACSASAHNRDSASPGYGRRRYFGFSFRKHTTEGCTKEAMDRDLTFPHAQTVMGIARNQLAEMNISCESRPTLTFGGKDGVNPCDFTGGLDLAISKQCIRNVVDRCEERRFSEILRRDEKSSWYTTQEVSAPYYRKHSSDTTDDERYVAETITRNTPTYPGSTVDKEAETYWHQRRFAFGPERWTFNQFLSAASDLPSGGPGVAKEGGAPDAANRLVFRALERELQIPTNAITSCTALACEWTWYRLPRNDEAIREFRLGLGCPHPPIATSPHAAPAEKKAHVAVPKGN